MHWKLGNRFYQKSKYLVITLLISILMNFTGCGNENSDIGVRQVDSDNEQIQVDIKYVEPFDPYYKIFYLETGDRIMLSDVLGTDYTAEQIKNLAWKAYQKRMEEVPDQYSKELFDEYCRLLFDEGGWTWSPEWENTEGWPLEEYFHYYFTDDGMVITYSAKGDFAVPVIYRLNERLEPITVENGKAIQMTLDWKDIN